MTTPNALLDQAQDRVQDAAADARSRLRRVADATSDYAQRGMQRVRQTGADVRDSALDARDATLDYVRDEPLKAVLIAAVAGAALATGVMLLRRLTRR
jgi:ElaB/YqjD/DUF883 family membrane-anchored ribosome-binding protein